MSARSGAAARGGVRGRSQQTAQKTFPLSEATFPSPSPAHSAVFVCKRCILSQRANLCHLCTPGSRRIVAWRAYGVRRAASAPAAPCAHASRGRCAPPRAPPRRPRPSCWMANNSSELGRRWVRVGALTAPRPASFCLLAAAAAGNRGRRAAPFGAARRPSAASRGNPAQGARWRAQGRARARRVHGRPLERARGEGAAAARHSGAGRTCA